MGNFHTVAASPDESWVTVGETLPADGWAMHRGMQLRGAPTFQDISLDVGPGGAMVSESMTYGRPFGG